jgi:cell division septum initiation protein DivIVA
MTTAPNLTPTEVIDRVRAARKAQQQAAVEEIELALEWARLHPCPVNETPAHWGEADLHDEGLVPLAGQGAPWVAEFAPVDLAAALGISQDAGRQLIADALELAHRLPRLWKRVLAGEVPVWRARLIARETTDLSVKATLFADRLIAATPRRIGQVKAAQLVHEARLYFDPDRAIADEEEALTKRGVWLRHNSAPATTDVTMTLDTPDALLFDQTVARIAGDLRELGDAEDLEVRRARAVGILADPQFALDLLSGRDTAAPSHRGGATNLYVHLTPAGLEADLYGVHRCRVDREARRRHHPAAHRLAHPIRRRRHQDHAAPGPRPQLRLGCGPARPTRGDAGDRGPA